MEGQFKRTICKFWLEGTCSKGDSCTWSHAEEDLQHGGPPPQAPPQEKKTICKFWLEGICKSGDNCTWAHGERELGMPLPGMQKLVSRAAGDAYPHKNGLGKGAFARSPLHALGPASTPPHPWSRTGSPLGGFQKGAASSFSGGFQKGAASSFSGGFQKGGFQKGAASSLPPKRTLCKFWMEGNCEKGDRCTWAHGEEDIGSVASEPVTAPTARAHPVGAAPLHVQPTKRTQCKFWIEGRCQNGDACTWAHGEEDVGNSIILEDALEDQELEEYLVEGLSEEDVAGILTDDTALPAGPIHTRRTICKFWLEGKCIAGERCTWAHGEEDVGTMVVLEEPLDDMAGGPTHRKRTLCKFWMEGTCQKGDRCTWAHGEDEVGVEVPIEAVVDHRPPLLNPLLSKGAGRVGPFTAAWKGKGGPIGTAAAAAPAAPAPDWMGPNAKRTMCKFWQLGTCREGANCTYAHGDQELGGGGSTSSSSSNGKGVKGGFLFPTLVSPIASPRVEVSRSVPQEVERRGIKRSMCKFWLESICTKGDQCTFAHGDEEIGAPIPGDWPDEERPPILQRSTSGSTPCRFFAMGTCSKGLSCTFAHIEATDDAYPSAPWAKRQRLVN